MIRITGLTKSFDRLPVFRDLSLEIRRHRVTALLGPSGCGKTTLLNLLSGTLEPDGGTVEGVEGKRISYLFQEPRLLPWKTVEQNLDLVLKAVTRREERKELIFRTLAAVGLAEFAHYYPEALSGGMRQRAAMARAFAYPGEILLMDEPFQALDLGRKISLVRDFEGLWRDDRRTGIFVTHDVHEALMLGDCIIVFSHRPATVVDSMENPVPHEERSLKHEAILNLEKKVYRALLQGKGDH
ncbi:MAG: ABC transporter ATP-binding protein [Spirochaetales bacterium]|nr:ABC transporter ATP-binding protein [Spirochaetales bacterium]